MTSNTWLYRIFSRQQALRTIILLLWIAALSGIKAKGEIPLIYLLPILSLITCFMLDMFAGLICSVLTSGLIILAVEVPQDAQFAVLGVLWASMLLIFVLRQNTEPEFPPIVRNINEGLEQPNEQPFQNIELRQAGINTKINGHLDHDLRTPINLIAGYCEAILNPVTKSREPLSALYRADIEVIRRNALQLETILNESLVVSKSVPQNVGVSTQLRTDSQAAKTIILLTDNEPVTNLFKAHVSTLNVVSTSSSDDIFRSKPSPIDPSTVAAIVVTSETLQSQVNILRSILGKNIPVIRCQFLSLKQILAQYPHVSHLLKPVSHPVLSNAINKFAIDKINTSLTNILIIDDNPELVRLFTDMLRTIVADAIVWNAYSGSEGLALIKEEQPDLVILDLRLPDMDGFAVIDEIYTKRRLTIPILLISGVAEESVVNLTTPTTVSIDDGAGNHVSRFAGYIQAIVQSFGTKI